MFDRARLLAHSNFGRDFGWYIEYEGAVIAELDDPQYLEMFWDSYRIQSTSAAGQQAINNVKLWDRCVFAYRNKVLDEYTAYGFSAAGPPMIHDGRIAMRGLYLSPRGWLESKATDIYRWLGSEPVLY